MKHLIAALFAIFALSAHAEPNPVIAKVGDAPIYQSEVNQYLYQFLTSRGVDVHGVDVNQPSFNLIKQNIIDTLVEREIIAIEAAKNKPADLKQKVDAEMQKVISRYPSQAAFEAAQQNNGSSIEMVRNSIEKKILLANHLQSLVQKVKVEEAELKRFYESNKARFIKPETVTASHILIRNAGDAEQKIQEAYAKVKAGEDFAELAKTYSQDNSASRGGDLGSFGRGMMVPEFDKVAFATKPGEISEPVQTQVGYHIIKVTAYTPAETIPFAEAKERIAMQLKQTKVERNLTDMAAKLREHYKVEVFLPKEKSAEATK